MNYLIWLLKAAIFFTLFAFALNNQQTVAVNFFFGTYWKAPLVLVVLTTFAIGLGLGVLLMMPRWWKRRVSQDESLQQQHVSKTAGDNTNSSSVLADSTAIPRHGL